MKGNLNDAESGNTYFNQLYHTNYKPKRLRNHPPEINIFKLKIQMNLNIMILTTSITSK